MSHVHQKYWVYQAQRRLTQTAGGGGALVCRISVGTGIVAALIRAKIVGTASNTTLQTYPIDEDGVLTGIWTNIGAAASIQGNLPGLGAASTATNTTQPADAMVLSAGSYLLTTSAAAAQNEYMDIGVVFKLNAPVTPTWDTTGSAGTPSLAASSISAANTMVMVIE